MGFSGTVVNIDLENDLLIMHGNANESPGCVLRGVLNLHLKQPTKVKSIILTLTGTIQISWTQPLAHGHEQFFRSEKSIVSHQWIFLRPQYARSHLLGSGNHSYEFECFMAGDLPESIKVAQFYVCQYQLKATIQRPHFLPKFACRRLVHVTRQQLHPSISPYPGSSLLEPVTIAQRWLDKLDYRISIPSKLYHHGDVIPITLRLQALNSDLLIRQLTCTFKEYASCKPVNGWFGGRTRSHRRILYYVRKGQSSITALSSSADRPGANGFNSNTDDDESNNIELDPCYLQLTIPVPDTLDDIQCDTYSDSVRIRHKLKFVVSVGNVNGTSLVELRAVLPVVIQAKPAALLPSYEQCHDGQSFPYDPALMVALLRRNEQQQEDDDHQQQDPQQTLPTQQQHQRRRRLLQHRRMSCSIDHDIQQQRGTVPPDPITTTSNNTRTANTLERTRRFAFHRMSLPLPLPSFSQPQQSHHVLSNASSNDIIPALSRLPTYEEIHCH